MEGTQDDCAVPRRAGEASMEHDVGIQLHSARTTYVLAQAPPLPRTQRIFNATPRLLLQLQELSTLVRPQPVIEVVVANFHAPKLSPGGWLEMFQRLKGWRDNRIMVLRIDNYNDDTVKNALAVIVGRHRDNQRAEICLVGGSTWRATRSPNGVFKFILETGTSNRFSVAKWRPAGRIGHEINIPPRSAAGSKPTQDQQYKFSIIHPGRRQHPVLASLTRTRLEIAENRIATGHNHDRSGMDLVSTDEASDESRNLPAPKEVDDDVKTLIQVTAILVTLSLGCCTSFSLNERSSSANGQSTSDHTVHGNSTTFASLGSS